MQQHVNTNHPQVYKTMVNISLYSETTKEDRLIAVAGEINEAPEIELIILSTTPGS